MQLTVRSRKGDIRPVTELFMKPKSWLAFEWVKGVSVIGMVLVHALYWTWTAHGSFLLPAENVWFAAFKWGMFLGVCPLMLPFLAGVAYRLRLCTQFLHSEKFLFGSLSKLFWQCIVLASLGYAINVISAGWYAIWAWNVLQLVALSLLIIGVLYVQGSIWFVVTLGFLVLALSDPLREWIPNEDRSELLRVILGDPSDWHQWSIFPWMATVASGFVLADSYLRLDAKRFIRLCNVTGGVFFVFFAIVARGHIMPIFDPNNLIGPKLMQPPAMAVLGLLGLMLLVVGCFTVLQHRLQLPRYGIVRCFSGGILEIYLVHMAVGVRLHDLVFSNVDQAALLTTLGQGWHPLLMIGFPTLLLLISWAIGYVAIRFIYEKRFSVRLRKVGSSTQKS